MQSSGKRGIVKQIVYIWMAVFALLLGGGSVCLAAPVNLDIFVFHALLDEGGNPLADGSIIEIVGAGTDGLAGDGGGYGGTNLFQTWGGTNLIAGSTLGDDQILATTVVNSSLTGSNGTFFVTIQNFDPVVHPYVYIRFYNTTSAITGMVYWGASTVAVATNIILGVVTVQADPAGSLQATNYNNFVVIPEPSTVNLFLVTAVMMVGMRAGLRRRRTDRRPGNEPT